MQPLAHDRYLALARGEAVAFKLAGHRLILNDWYPRVTCGRPAAVVNATYSWLVFDAQGLLDINAAHAIDAEAALTQTQWEEVYALVFGDVSRCS